MKVFGRLGKNNPHAHKYKSGGELEKMSTPQQRYRPVFAPGRIRLEVRPEHATRFDVYSQDR